MAPRRGRLQALGPREGDRDRDRGGRGGARAPRAARRRPSVWPCPCGGPCAPGAARGPSRAPSPWPAARACATCSGLPSGPRRSSRSSSGRFERASREIQKPTASSATTTPPAMIHSVVVPMSSSVACRTAPPWAPAWAAPAAGCRRTGCRPGRARAAGASRTRRQVRMARRWRMTGAQGTTMGAGAPVSAQRLPAKRSAAGEQPDEDQARPARPTRRVIPQPWSSASSATGT